MTQSIPKFKKQSLNHLIIIGVMLGLSFGGSLLIKEAKTGGIEKKDIFLTMVFLALAHSLIEDT